MPVTRAVIAVRRMTTLVFAVYPHTFHQTVSPRLALAGSNWPMRSSSLALPVVAKGAKMKLLAEAPNATVTGRRVAYDAV